MSKTSGNSKLEEVSITLKGLSNFDFSIEALLTQFICLPAKNQIINLIKNDSKFLKDLELADTGSSDKTELIIGSDFCCALLTGTVKIGKIWHQLAFKVNSAGFEIVPYHGKMFLPQILVL